MKECGICVKTPGRPKEGSLSRQGLQHEQCLSRRPVLKLGSATCLKESGVGSGMTTPTCPSDMKTDSASLFLPVAQPRQHAPEAQCHPFTRLSFSGSNGSSCWILVLISSTTKLSFLTP